MPVLSQRSLLLSCSTRIQSAHGSAFSVMGTVSTHRRRRASSHQVGADKNKQHQPLPLVGMGLFIDHDGIPMAFDIFPGSKNEQPTLKPRNEDRIKAHFITCFIALTIYRLLEKKLGERFTCEEIIETLKDMYVDRIGEKLGYRPAYTRTDLTDALHENFGFRTDYEIISEMKMKKIIRQTKDKSK